MQESIAEDFEKFRNLKSRNDLANLFKYEAEKWTYLLYRLDSQLKYHKFKIPKKNGEPRTIHAPNAALLNLQKKLLTFLNNVYKPKSSAHGFILTRSIISNATPHTNARFVFNLDIEDFFPSIHFGRIRGLFLKYPFNFPKDVASDLANLCCVDGKLPQGSPTSPILSNMICRKLDSSLENLARKHNCFYTRYADDITFSTKTNKFPPEIACSIIENPMTYNTSPGLEHIIKANGFKINARKVRMQRKFERQEVTGLIVNKKINVLRSQVRQTKSMLHAWKKFGYKKAANEFINKYDKKFRTQPLGKDSFKEVIRGKLNFIKLVRGENDTIYRNLLHKFQKLDPKCELIPPKTDTDRVLDSLWVIEDINACKSGTAFSLKAVGIVTCEHVLSANMYAFRASQPSQHYSIKVLSKNKDIDLAIIEVVDGPQVTELEQATNPSVDYEDSVILAGFPDYRLGDTPYFAKGNVVSFRNKSTIRRFLISANIIQGNSGGPVLNKDYKVIGVAVTGAPSFTEAKDTENHGVIPISALALIEKKT